MVVTPLREIKMYTSNTRSYMIYSRKIIDFWRNKQQKSFLTEKKMKNGKKRHNNYTIVSAHCVYGRSICSHRTTISWSALFDRNSWCTENH